MPKVSIIIPVYNVEKYLKKCLNCIVNQTLTDFEVICINDGSTDNSLEILNEYAKNDKRFIVISQENQGQGVARNRCLELVKGEYIQFIDPDDWVEINMLETLYDFAKKHDSQIVKFDYFEFFEYSNKLKKIDFVNRIKKDFNYDLISKPYYSWRQLKKGCLTKFDLHVWAHFYSAEFIKSNNIRFNPTKHGEDHLFANGALILADRVDYLNEYLYYYRIRSGSAVNIKSDQNFCVFDNIEQFKKFLIQHSLYEELKDEFKDYAQQAVCWPYDMIPQESKKRYEELCCRYFESEKDFKKLIKAREKGRSFIENIFSIKNKRDGAKKYKVITVLGCPMKIDLKKRPRKFVSQSINIALGFDKHFLPHGATTIKSIIDNNRNVAINFVIMINDSINFIDKFLLKKLVGENNNIQFINMARYFENLFEGSWSIAMYYPIMLSSICKDSKILFLDADTLVTGDLLSFYNTDLTNYYCAAVKDFGLEIQIRKGKSKLKINNKDEAITIANFMYNKLKFSKQELNNYFNSGVLLLNLDKIRGDKLENKMLTYLKQKDLMFPDQDCLNVFFKGKTKLMPYTYNFQVIGKCCTDLFDESDIAIYDNYLNSNKNPLIIHYLDKPFRSVNKVCFGEKYFKYRSKTFWRFTIDENFKKKIIRFKISNKRSYLYLFGCKCFDVKNLLNKEKEKYD